MSRSSAARLLTLTATLAGLAWAYWPALRIMADKWADDPQYSHGFLVVPFAAFLLWARRDRHPSPLPAASAWGLGLLAAGAALHLAGAWFYFEWFEGVSLLVCLAGVAVLVGGWPLLRWSWPAIAFLLFMVPLPHRVESALSGTLQQTATSSCAAVLHTLGRPALAEGNVLTVEGNRVEVVAACSGLGSLLVFFAMAVGVGLLSGRPMLDRILLALGAVPIALVANVVRITLTALLAEDARSYETYHEMAGWLMMGLALGLLWAELWLLRRLFPEAPGEAPGTPCDAPSC